MAATYDSIASYTFPSPLNTYTLSSIDGSYTDLRIVLEGRMSGSISNFIVRFNGDSSSIYYTNNLLVASTSRTYSYGNGVTSVDSIAQWRTSDGRSHSIIDLPNYAQTGSGGNNRHKGGSILTTSSTTSTTALGLVGFKYSSNSAISSVTISSPSASFDTGTTINLYGITRG